MTTPRNVTVTARHAAPWYAGPIPAKQLAMAIFHSLGDYPKMWINDGHSDVSLVQLPHLTPGQPRHTTVALAVPIDFADEAMWAALPKVESR